MAARKPYQGECRKLVLAFDIGTTYSGVSYSLLDPGVVPVVEGVTRFPAQEHVGGNSKIPSVIYYDKTGAVRAVGAEAFQQNVIEEAEDEGWDKVEWFKLHLRPRTMASGSQKILPLPKNKTIVQVFADCLDYLFKCARDYIQDTRASGEMFWESIQGHIEFVLTHPNGWEGPQQNQMRRATILAGLVPDTPDGRSKIQFVTEGEASLHFCVCNRLAKDAIARGQGFIVVDAGGGTVDLSAYSVKTSPNGFEEIAEPACYFNGSMFVSRRAREFLQEKLQGSQFGVPEEIDNIISHFDKTTKLTFKNDNEPSWIVFGGLKDHDTRVGIRAGKLKLAGTEVAALFEPSIQAIVGGIAEQLRVAHQPITSIFLVGGFAASDWLFKKLQAYLQPLRMDFCRPDHHVNKAVADGAISYYIDHYVSVRVARFTYGALCAPVYDKTNSQHLLRAHTLFTDLSGRMRIDGLFDAILSKGTRVSESKEFREYYSRNASNPDGNSREIITCYRGFSKSGGSIWVDTEPDMFSTLCTVHADISGMSKTLMPQRGLTGSLYYNLKFGIILCFGLTELKAQIVWTENGKEMRGPATIMYEDTDWDM